MSRLKLHLFAIIITALFTGNANAFFMTYVPKLKDSHLVTGQASTQALNPESIKVMVWNIHKGKDKGFYEDFTHYGADRDILMIQELYNSKHVMDSLEQFNDFRFDIGISFRYRFKKHIFSGTMIGSHVKPTYTKLSRTRDREPVVNTPKVLTIGSYPIEGHNDLLIINIHGMNVTSNKAFYRQVDDAIRAMSGHRGPIIFAGDFNTNRQKRIDYLQRNLVERLGFKDMQFRNDKRMRSAFTNLIIDFTFTRGLKVVDSEVLGDLESSDHKAMYFEVAVDTDKQTRELASK